MRKYEALGQFLLGQKYEEVPMTFAEIERVTGAKLPKSQRYPAWWSNNPSNNVMTKIWLDAGFRTERVDIAAKKLVFKRTAKSPFGGEMAETHRGFRPAEHGAEKTPRRSPLFGALKGTFIIEPEWDPTKPALDPEEMEEWEANLERKAQLYEKGLSRKS